MAKDQPIFVKDAVFKLQMSLLEGIQNEDQLFAAGSLMSRSDYEDQLFAAVCIHETYMYCSSNCVVNNKAFSGSLQDERCSVLDPEKLNNVLRLFGNMNLESVVNLGKDGDLGLSGLKIQEKKETTTGEVSLEQWIGPSNAIEGYVPKQRDSDFKGSSRKNIKEGSKATYGKLNGDKNLIYNEMDFMSTIIMQDEYSVSKVSSRQTETTADHQIKPKAVVEQPKRVGSKVVRKDDDSIQELSSYFESGLNLSISEKGNQ